MVNVNNSIHLVIKVWRGSPFSRKLKVANAMHVVANVDNCYDDTYDNIFLKTITIYNKVANATHAVANVDDYSGSARLLAATTLRQAHIHCLMVLPFFCFILRDLYG